MDKPKWINEVKEITREEAELLLSLGVEVRADYNHGRLGWFDEPHSCEVVYDHYYLDLLVKDEGDKDLLFWIPNKE